jgi:AraC family transcriptional regulator, regulatory protein of adaptative response / DNA-3-methyladenine glycosylase II
MSPISGPFDWSAALGFLARRAIDGVEEVKGETYHRVISLGESPRVLSVGYDARTGMLRLTLSGSGELPEEVIKRVRRMFDADADLAVINAHLSRDPFLAASVASYPAVRVAGGWDAFEIAIRTVIGQQVSVARARQLNAVLVDRCAVAPRKRQTGSDRGLLQDGLRRAFPAPQDVLAADLSALGMPGARAATLRAVAAAALDDPEIFEPAATLDQTIARLRRIRGIGEWTAHYIAMRACRHPDAFPASDVGLLRGAADADGRRPTAAALLQRAEPWRPWRAYAAHRLWGLDSTARDGVLPERVDATLHS